MVSIAKEDGTIIYQEESHGKDYFYLLESQQNNTKVFHTAWIWICIAKDQS